MSSNYNLPDEEIEDPANQEDYPETDNLDASDDVELGDEDQDLEDDSLESDDDDIDIDTNDSDEIPGEDDVDLNRAE